MGLQIAQIAVGVAQGIGSDQRSESAFAVGILLLALQVARVVVGIDPGDIR